MRTTKNYVLFKGIIFFHQNELFSRKFISRLRFTHTHKTYKYLPHLHDLMEPFWLWGRSLSGIAKVGQLMLVSQIDVILITNGAGD